MDRIADIDHFLLHMPGKMLQKSLFLFTISAELTDRNHYTVNKKSLLN